MKNCKIIKPLYSKQQKKTLFSTQTQKQCLLFQFVYRQQINTDQFTCCHDDGVVGTVALLFVVPFDDVE